MRVVGRAPSPPSSAMTVQQGHVVGLANVLKLSPEIASEMLMQATIVCWCEDGKHKMVRDSFRVDL